MPASLAWLPLVLGSKEMPYEIDSLSNIGGICFSGSASQTIFQAGILILQPLYDSCILNNYQELLLSW